VDRNSGTAARLTALYETYAADAFRFALHLTGRREDAEDVVQHVFLQAYAVLEAGRELVNPRAWLIKATKHRSLNLIRDRRDTPAAELDPPAPVTSDEGEAEALDRVRAALWSLPESQHHAFVLRHWSGLSQGEIADVLATTPAAVESLLVRARTAIVAERDDADGECAGVRGRLARMLAPTPAQSAHVAGCRRCRTAQTRLLRAAEFATTFALVPGPHVLHTLAASIPGFGGAVAGASATGTAAGAGGGGAAVSAASAATKAGLLTKFAVVATTAAVAVTAVHPLRTVVTHAILRHPPVTAAAAAPKRHAGHAAGASAVGAARADAGAPVSTRPTPPATAGGDPATGDAGTTSVPTDVPPARDGAGNGKSGTAGSNGDGNGQDGASGATHGKSATAPGRTKTAGNGQAKGAGKGDANGSGNGLAKGAGTGQGAKPTATKTSPGGGGTKTPPAGGTSNGNGNTGGSGTPPSGGTGNGSGNAGGNGKGNGKP
jgi:RNA polymerase sigma factor (sigma-70 family)